MKILNDVFVQAAQIHGYYVSGGELYHVTSNEPYETEHIGNGPMAFLTWLRQVNKPYREV